MKKKFLLSFPLSALIFLLFVMLYASNNYIGSSKIYFLFSFVFCSLLFSGFYKNKFYSYTFLCIFLWLGFWLKITSHLVIGHVYQEPTGSFSGTVKEWDDILLLATLGAVGVLSARIAFSYLWKQKKSVIANSFYPVWYPSFRKPVWLFSVLAIFIVALANGMLGISQSGLYAQTELIWPLNAIITWLLSIGFSLGIATLTHWEMAYKKEFSSSFKLIMFEATLSTLSLISRGIYIFHTIPQFYSYLRNKSMFKKIRIRDGIGALLLFIVTSLISLVMVMVIRNYFYSGIKLPIVSSIESNKKITGSVVKETILEVGGLIDRMRPLIIDRWIGPEGLMSVYSYPDKSWHLFLDAVTEKPEIGKLDLYQKICNSIYSDSEHFYFVSLPGPIAFFYYTGKKWMIFIGLFLMTCFALFTEMLIIYFFRNPFYASAYGVYVANSIAQFGLIPRLVPKHYTMIFCGFLFLWYIQSKYFTKTLEFFKLYKKPIKNLKLKSACK